MKKALGLLVLLAIPAFALISFLPASKGSPDAEGPFIQSPPGIPPAGTTGGGGPVKTQPSNPGDKTTSPGDRATTPDENPGDATPPENPDGTLTDAPPDVTPDGTVPTDTTGTEQPPDDTGTLPTTDTDTVTPDTGTGTTTTTTGTGTTTTTTGTGITPTTGTGRTPATGTGPTNNKGGNIVTTTTTPKNPDTLEFDFHNTPLDQVVKYFAAQVNKNFIIPKTLGTSSVTIITGRPLPKEKAFEVLESILLTEQWSMYEDENFVRIEKQGTPQDKTISTEVKLIKDLIKEQDEKIGTRDKTLTAIVVLNYINAQEIVNILTPMRSPSAVMVAFSRINALFIRDTERNIGYTLSIIEKLDQPGTVGNKITIVKLQYSVAAELSGTLGLVLQANAMETIDMGMVPPPPGTARQPGARGAAGGINIIPDKRTNTLIIIATEKETEALMNLISELDVPPLIQDVGVHTYQCNNQKAEDLAKILGDFVDKRPPVQQAAGQPPVPQGISGMPQIDYFFIADKVTNTLIIQAPPQDWPLYREILKNLDQPQRQALIEVWIVEVSSTDDQTLGVEIMPSDQPPNERTGPLQNEIYGVSRPTTSSSALFGGTTTTDTGQTATGSQVGSGATIGIRALTSTEISIDGRRIRIPNFDTFIRAVKSKSSVKILASPKLVTLNNKKATVNITDEISIRTSEITTVETTGNVNNVNYSRKEVGILLDIEPQINADDFVIMDLSLEISNVVGELTTDPTIARRTTKAAVRCENKQTIVISGLRRENKTKTKTGVPLLGDIPLVGRMFSTVTQNSIDTNLLIFITPHIVTDTSDMLEMTDILKKQRLADEEGRLTIVGKNGKQQSKSASKVIWKR